MRENVLNWVTKGDKTIRLDANFLMLFGNPYLFQEAKFTALFSGVSRAGLFYRATYKGHNISYCYPLFGAPMVAMYTEALSELGVRNIIACGYVGGLGEYMDIGSYVIPLSATGRDGCTRAYFPRHASFAASAFLSNELAEALSESRAKSQAGPIVSIDALMLEDDRMIQEFKEQGYLAIDLETACLYGLGAHLGLEVSSIHIVSDNPTHRLIDQERFHEASFVEQIEIASSALLRISHSAKP
jgi:uridine phosphorylase